MSNQAAVRPSPGPDRPRRFRSGIVTTVALLVLVVGAAVVVVAVRRSPEPMASQDTGSTTLFESRAGAGDAVAAPAGSAASVETGDSIVPSTARQASSRRAPATSLPAVVPHSRSVAALSLQRGIQVYLHTAPDPGAEDNIDAILDYVVGLGANSVAVTFPLYTDGAYPSRVYADVETPSPRRVADVVARAHDRGLRVTIRPLIDEANIASTPEEWRGSIEPIDVGAWFDSYETAIRPYFRTGADEFVLAAELNSLQGEAEQWSALEQSARSAFPGVISYTFNWDGVDQEHLPMLSSYGVDLYPLSDLGDDATVEDLAAVMLFALGQQPEHIRRSLVIHEVGIAALSGVYRLPSHWGTEGGPILEEVQAKWFSAACRAAKEAEVRGLYFWMLDSNIDPLRADPADQPPKSFIGRLAEASIRECFAG